VPAIVNRIVMRVIERPLSPGELPVSLRRTANRTTKMADKEQDHRIGAENTRLAAEEASVRRGQYLGAAVTCAAITGAVIVTLAKGSWQATVALVGVPILSAVREIVNSRHARRHDSGSGSTRH